MNKNVMFLAFSLLGGVGIVGTFILQIHRPDASATFTAFVATILGLTVTAAVTFYGLGKVNEKLDEVKTQTNGTLSKRDEKIAEQEAELIELRAAVARKQGQHSAS
ncbi:hypothetical protein ASF48_06950 [Rathayibacter sp. Leaf299]|uniref:hypothetical protein n=1 Tax=Rathayibacter sp. Leaf299 TaxID=1736328 RepID=UPI0006F61394|nr:hypothetical protein [Rathayibacter sp. Leaf299]KQQ22868.1 hypothetical protein ASF48_06950 [Rathayibacter sp. Leaf299]